jgi:hypothetical protein
VPDIAELLTADLHRVFGNRDAVSRRAAVEETYAADVVFSDPDETLVGRDALEEKAAALLAGAPADAEFAEDGPAYVGAGWGALAWRLGPTDAPLARGVDVVVVVDGRITELRTALAS